MAEQKTKATAQSVSDYLASLENLDQQSDCQALVKIMQDATGYPATMWGTRIIGFGHYRYVYESGHSGESCIVGFGVRKNDISLYLHAGSENRELLLEKLGPHKSGKGCVYIKRVADIDVRVLTKLIKETVKQVLSRYPQ